MEQSDLLRYTIELLERINVTYAIVGSFASSAYGEPRFTMDIDMVIDLTAGQVAEFCAQFPNPEFYISEPAVKQAVVNRTQFNVIHPTSGSKIDFMLSGNDAWERNQLKRRQVVALFPDCDGYVASPEDVMLGKMIYYREGGSDKHLRDITGILKLRGESIDRDYLQAIAEQVGVTEIWQAVLNRMDEPKSN